MKYVRLYSDADGESHFENCEVEFDSVDFAPPAPPLLLSQFQSAKRVAFLTAPRGWQGDWHPSPARQFFITVQGELEVEASDGQTRYLRPGAVVLGEDTSGKGHRSRSTGDEDLVAALVQLD